MNGVNQYTNTNINIHTRAHTHTSINTHTHTHTHTDTVSDKRSGYCTSCSTCSADFLRFVQLQVFIKVFFVSGGIKDAEYLLETDQRRLTGKQ